MFQESFIDAAIIAQNLLNDPLDISTCDNDITMLSTALSLINTGPRFLLKPNYGNVNHLSRRHGKLIKELELLADDLTSSL